MIFSSKEKMGTNGRRIPIKTEPLTAKMSPEIYKAIKRHEKTGAGGFDYWKTGFSGLGSVAPSPIEKRPTFQNMAEINLDFPGVFLPNVGSVLNKPRRRDSFAGVSSTGSPAPQVLIRRSNTTLGNNSIQDKRLANQTAPTFKKPMTDPITCLQLSDSLMSYQNAPFPNGSLKLYRAPQRSNCTDYFGEDANSPDADENGDWESNTDDMQGMVPSMSNTSIMVDQEDNEVIANYGNGQSNGVDFNDNDKSVFQSDNNKPYKSILKNNYKRQSWIFNEEHLLSPREKITNLCSYQLPTSRSRHCRVPSATLHNSSSMTQMLNTAPRPLHNGYVYNSFGRQSSANSSTRMVPIERANTFSDVVDITSRKRCVRFNVVHQVHEYRPGDPIIQC